ANPDGTFVQGNSYMTEPRSDTIAVGDLNRDGATDLVIGTPYEPMSIRVWLGAGDGTFAPSTSVIADAIVGGVSELADLNGDGALDLVISGRPFTVMLGRGDGTFACAVRYGGGFGPASLAFADVNGDGRLDVVGAGSDLTVLLSSH